MTQHMPPEAMSLFDLIARPWDLGSEVRQVLFNATGSAMLAVLADGRLAFLRTEDAEDPDKRMRMDVETGRTTIRPREMPLPAPVMSDGSLVAETVPVSAMGEKGFAFVHRTGGEVWRATARGQTLRVARGTGEAVTALCVLPGSDRMITARGSLIALLSAEDGAEIATANLAHEVRRMAVSPDGRSVACWGPGAMSIVTCDGLATTAEIACDGDVATLAWSPDARWLVGGCEDKALLIVDVPAAGSDRIVDFPAAVRSVTFSAAAKALVAAGAFRAAGWQLPDLPFGAHEGSPIETGKPGLTLVEAVAAHPLRDLCAVGYANGLVTICQVGRREELMLHEGTGGAVASLAWSANGKHLAIGTREGKAAIVTFPKNMFK